MGFEEISKKYEEKFGVFPPILTTLDVENKKYLEMLEKAIELDDSISRNDLAEEFMEDEDLLY